MKKLLSSMDPSNTISRDESCPSHAYNYFVNAATLTDPQEIEHTLSWADGLQGQCLTLIHTLAQKEAMYREDPTGINFIEPGYNDVIEFIAGVGVACTAMTTRLKNAEHGEDLRS